MASISYPRPAFNAGKVTELQYEHLASAQAADGVVGTPADQPLVYSDGTGIRTVKVRLGRRALVRGHMYESGTSDIPIELAANVSGAVRIDLIVLRLTRSTMRVQEAAITGTPGAGTPAGTNDTGDTGVWDFPIARVTVASGATALAASTVTPTAWYLGDDGQILCTAGNGSTIPSTRPPHQAGRRIFEVDTGKALISTGSSWVIEYEDTGWVGVSLAAGWSSQGTRVRRVNGVVTMQLDIARAGTALAAGTPSNLANLAVEFRPLNTLNHVGWLVSSGAAYGWWTVSSAGLVRIESAGLGPTSAMRSTATWPAN